jgi:hypothetical protein
MDPATNGSPDLPALREDSQASHLHRKFPQPGKLKVAVRTALGRKREPHAEPSGGNLGLGPQGLQIDREPLRKSRAVGDHDSFAATNGETQGALEQVAELQARLAKRIPQVGFGRP